VGCLTRVITGLNSLTERTDSVAPEIPEMISCTGQTEQILRRLAVATPSGNQRN
jgi:hypothetical protein